MNQHKAGFVNIIGKPNAGKSTLMNLLVGEKLSIITPKAQTTRHRILGIVNNDACQIVFSDTPGYLSPKYKMHEAMNQFVEGSFQDADIIVYLHDITDKEINNELLAKLKKIKMPVMVIINKIDLAKETEINKIAEFLKEEIKPQELITISALKNINTEPLLGKFISILPEHPPYYPKDQLTDKPERFFIAQIIREKILLNYHQEIPYHVEVVIEAFVEEPNITKIRAEIYVSRPTHKSILIGKGGSAIKQLGIDSRKDIEAFLDKKVFLELFVKVKENWTDDPNSLKNFGYL